MRKPATSRSARTVAIVLRDDFSAELSELSRHAAVWVLGTPKNLVAAKTLRAPDREITTFDEESDWSSDAEQIYLLETVLEHHARCSHLEWFGMTPTPALVTRLTSLGFHPTVSRKDGSSPIVFIRAVQGDRADD